MFWRNTFLIEKKDYKKCFYFFDLRSDPDMDPDRKNKAKGESSLYIGAVRLC